MVFFVAVRGVGLLLDMLHLLCSSSSDTFGMVLEPCSGMFLLVLTLDAQVEFGAFQKLGVPGVNPLLRLLIGKEASKRGPLY